MTQEELFNWVRMVLRGLASFAVFVTLCIIAGYLLTKMEMSEMKKTAPIPDCGKCSVYPKGVKK